MDLNRARGRGRYVPISTGTETSLMGTIRKRSKDPEEKSLPSGGDDNLSGLPGGYYKTYRRPDKSYGVRFIAQYMDVEETIYGKTLKRAKRYWNSFCRLPHSISITLTGDSGGGKTLEGRLLANLAIANGDLPVVEITGYKLDETTVRWMDENDEVVYFLDEFGKHTPPDVQEMILPLLTNTNRKSIFILTDNDPGIMNRFFKNRPGRIRYSKHFGKLERDVVEEYMDDHGVTGKFREDLMKFYNMAKVFVIDHLKEIIVEHKEYPEDTLEEMLEILNVDATSVDKKYYLVGGFKILDSSNLSIDEMKDIASAVKLDKTKVKEIDFAKCVQEPYSFEQGSYLNSVTLYDDPSEDVVKEKLSKLSESIINSKTVYVKTPVSVMYNISNLVFKEEDTIRLLADGYILIFNHAIQNTIKPNFLITDAERELVIVNDYNNQGSSNRFMM